MATFDNISFKNGLFLASLKCFPKSDYKTKEKISADGNYFWQVPIIAPSDREAETFFITVQAPSNPVEGLPIMCPIAVEGLTLTVGVMGGSKTKWFSFRASAIYAVK